MSVVQWLKSVTKDLPPLQRQRSITRKLISSEVARTKLAAVQRVAAAVGFAVIAECVEDPQVIERLKSLGVGYAQGFGIHKPEAVDQLAL